MFLLIFGLALFISIHTLPSIGNYRDNTIAKIGMPAYKVLYSLVSLAGIIAIVYGKGNAAYVDLWTPPSWGRIAVSAFMLITFILFSAMYAPSNIKRFTRHPMLWGVCLWSAGHLLANGDLASVLLFGSFGLFSLYAMWSANKRGAKKSTTSYPLKNDGIIAGIGVLIYAIVLFLHPYIAGVPIIS